jgi:hypothetical protein
LAIHRRSPASEYRIAWSDKRRANGSRRARRWTQRGVTPSVAADLVGGEETFGFRSRCRRLGLSRQQPTGEVRLQGRKRGLPGRDVSHQRRNGAERHVRHAPNVLEQFPQRIGRCGLLRLEASRGHPTSLHLDPRSMPSECGVCTTMNLADRA